MIFATTGIAHRSRSEPLAIKVDYTLSCAHVYARATVAYMAYTGPSVLAVAIHYNSHTSNQELPSWSLDWSRTSGSTGPVPLRMSQQYNDFRYVCDENETHVLRVPAVLHGKIQVLRNSLDSSGEALTSSSYITIKEAVLDFLSGRSEFTTQTYPRLESSS